MVVWLTLILLVLSTATRKGASSMDDLQEDARVQVQTTVSQSRKPQANQRVRQVATLNNTLEILYIEFTADGKFVSTQSDQSVRWWDTQTGATFHGAPNADVVIKNTRRTGCFYGSQDPFLRKLPNAEELESVSRSPDKKMLLTQKVVGRSSVEDWFVVQLWDLATPNCA